jgi:hypothetical protein
MSGWRYVGQQKYRVDGDMIFWEGSGDITVSEIAHIFETGMALQVQIGYVLFLISPHEPWSFPPAARRGKFQSVKITEKKY